MCTFVDSPPGLGGGPGALEQVSGHPLLAGPAEASVTPASFWRFTGAPRPLGAAGGTDGPEQEPFRGA